MHYAVPKNYFYFEYTASMITYITELIPYKLTFTFEKTRNTSRFSLKFVIPNFTASNEIPSRKISLFKFSIIYVCMCVQKMLARHLRAPQSFNTCISQRKCRPNAVTATCTWQHFLRTSGVFAWCASKLRNIRSQ